MKESVLTNRFSPGNPVPIFFAGRQEELTRLFLALIEFANSYPANYSGKLQFISGKAGIGKTALLIKLKQQIAHLPEFEKWIPVYISLSDVVKNPEDFNKKFLQEIEKVIIDSPAKRAAITKFLTGHKCQEVIAQIAPEMLFIIQKSISGARLVSLTPFFKQLREYYQNPAHLQELLTFCNLLLQECGYFSLYIIDHFEYLKTVPEFSEILLPCLEELRKKQWRNFILLGIDNNELRSLLESLETEWVPPLADLLGYHSAMIIKTANRLSYHGEKLSTALLYGNKFPVIAIPTGANAREIVNSLHNRCSSKSFTALIECLSPDELPTYLNKVAQKLVTKANEIADKASSKMDMNLSDLPQFKIESENGQLSGEKFAKFLVKMNRYLQRFPKISLVIFWKNFENLLPLSVSKLIKTRSITRKFSSGNLSTGGDNYLPSPAFLNFYSCLLKCVCSLSCISLVPIFVVPNTELPAENRSQIPPSFADRKIWKIKPLLQKDGVQLIQETAMRCGSTISKDIALDIYQCTNGNPMLLQHYGYYLLATLQDSFNLDEISHIKARLLKKYNPEIDTKNDRLSLSPDGRNRLHIPEKYYRDTAAFPPEKLYERMLFQHISHTAREIIALLAQQDEPLSCESVLATLSEREIENDESKVMSCFQELLEMRLIYEKDEEVGIIHPYVKTLIRVGFETKSIPGTEQSSSTRKRLTGVTENISTKKIELSEPTRKMSISPSPQKAFFSGEETQKQKMPIAQPTENAFDFMQTALSWLRAEQLPSTELLKRLSLYISLEETSPLLPVTMCYLYLLCSQIMEKVELKQSVDDKVAELQEALESSQSSHGHTDLADAVEQVLLGKKTIGELSDRHDHGSLCKLHFLRYQFFEKGDELKSAVENFTRSLVDEKRCSGLIELGSRMERVLLSRPEIKDSSRLRVLLKETLRIFFIERFDGLHETARGLLSLTANRVEEEFHDYMIPYLESLICKDTAISIKEMALRLLCTYGRTVPSHPEILEVLDEILSKGVSPSSKKAAAHALTHFLPFVGKDGSEQIIELLQAHLMEEKRISPRIVLLDIMANACKFQHHRLFIGVLLNLLQNEANSQLSIEAWHHLAKYKPFCEEKEQNEICEMLVDYYDTVLRDCPPEKIKPYTKTLLIALEKHRERIDEIIEKLLRGIADDNQPSVWKNSVAELAGIFPALTSEQKSKVAEMVAEWLNSTQSENRMAGFYHFYLLYPYADNLSQVLVDILQDKCSLEQQALFENIWRWVPYMESALRDSISIKILEMMRLSCQQTDIYPENLKNACTMTPYFDKNEKEVFSATIYYVLENENTATLLHTMNVAPTIFPYMTKDFRQKFQKACYYTVMSNDGDPLLWEAFLRMLSCCSSVIDEIANDVILCKIAEQMELYPEKLQGPALDFFANIWSKLPERLAKNLCRQAEYYLAFCRYADPALAFLIRRAENVNLFRHYAYEYQYYDDTVHLAFTLYEIYPQLADIRDLKENYETMLQKDPFPLVLKMADLQFRSGVDERAQQWIDWVLKQKGDFPNIEIDALRLQRKWQIFTYQGEEAQKTLEKIHKITFG